TGSRFRGMLPSTSRNNSFYYRCCDKNNYARTLIARLRLHRNIDIVRGGELDGARITGIHVTQNAHAGIAGENAFQAALGIFAPITNNTHTGLVRKTVADATAIVDRPP